MLYLVLLRLSFLVFVDSERTTYDDFGLPRATKVFLLKTMKFFAEQIVKEVEFPMMNIQEDVLQLGGDFTIDTFTKKLTFLHPSQTSSDRATLDKILEANK